MQTKTMYVVLFLSTFVSMFLLTFGVLISVLTYAPAVQQTVVSRSPYFPQLPISDVRDDDFFDITKSRGRQMFPTLASLDLPAAEGNWIRIPAIDVNIPLVTSISMSDEDVIKTLTNGAALYPNNIQPGRLGNIFIAAHSTGEPWKGAYRFAFLRINELASGNIVHIDYEGTRYTYRIRKSEIVIPTSDFLVVSDRPVPTLSLMACWPLWSTSKRMLVHGELTNITQLTPQPA